MLKFALSKCLRNQVLQLPVQHAGDRGDPIVVELPKQRRRLVVLQARSPTVILVNQHPQRGVETCCQVVPGHLDRDERVPNHVLHPFPLLTSKAQKQPVVGRAEEHEAAAPSHRLDPCSGSIGMRCVGSERLQHCGVELPSCPRSRSLPHRTSSRFERERELS